MAILMPLNFIKLKETAKEFNYAYVNDACADIYSSENITLQSNSTSIVHSGIAIELPYGYEGIIRGRSGLASKGILVHVGTIDENYRGEIGVIMVNTTNKPYEIKEGDKIAQFTIKPVIKIVMSEKKFLNKTERGENGYGSTGK